MLAKSSTTRETAMPQEKRVRNRKNIVQAVLDDKDQAKLDECLEHFRAFPGNSLYSVTDCIRFAIRRTHDLVKAYQENKNNSKN